MGVSATSPKARHFVVAAIFATLISAIAGISPAQATWLNYQSAPPSVSAVEGIPANYNLQQMHFGINDFDQSKFYFYLTFQSALTADQYSNGTGSFAAVNLDINGDGVADYALQTSTTLKYETDRVHPALLLDKSTGVDQVISKCDIQTFTNLTTSADWLGFSIPANCLSFGSTVGVQGVSHFAANSASATILTKTNPAGFWSVTIPNSTSLTKVESIANVNLSQAPTSGTQSSLTINSPAAAPVDLVALSANESKSVVTIKCNTSQGSGWSAKVKITAAMTAAGVKSYIVTNQHVVADCLKNKLVSVVLADQTEVQGSIVVADDINDLVGIAVLVDIPALEWQGSAPQQGWWMGIIGSPLGFPGVLTEGIVSSISISTSTGTTTAHINPGNSGGPAFDRNGRVIGIATAKYAAAEAFGIFHGAPMMCSKIVVCESAPKVWDSQLVPTQASLNTAPVVTENAQSSADNAKIQNESNVVKSAGTQLLNGAQNVLDQSVAMISQTAAKIPTAVSTLNRVKAVAPQAPTLTGDMSKDIQAIADFSTAVSDYQRIVVSTITSVEKSLKKTVAKVSITCVKGSTSKVVTGDAPKCPAGFNVKKAASAVTKL